jgi:hypothetical protein
MTHHRGHGGVARQGAGVRGRADSPEEDGHAGAMVA